MTATALTQEQLMFTKIVQNYMNFYGATGNRELNAFLKVARYDSQSNTDENRIVRFTLEKSTGTIDDVSSAGIPSNVDSNASRTPHEQIYTLGEKAGTYSLAWRNQAKLNIFIGSINVDVDSMDNLAERFVNEGYGTIIRQELAAKMWTQVLTDLKTALNGATTDTIFSSDVIVANSATIFNFDNLVTGSLSTDAEGVMEDVVSALTQQKDQHGNVLAFAQPKYAIVENSVYAKTIKELKKSYVVNEYDKNLLDLWDSSIVIAPLDLATAGDAYFFPATPGLKLMSETEMPVYHMGSDKYGNIVLTCSFIYKIGFSNRNVVKVATA
jgi:hypothetical protein